jgi:hypothetical protein
MDEIQSSDLILRHFVSVDQLHDRRRSVGKKPNKLRRRSLYHDPDSRSQRLSISSKRGLESPHPDEPSEESDLAVIPLNEEPPRMLPL